MDRHGGCSATTFEFTPGPVWPLIGGTKGRPGMVSLVTGLQKPLPETSI